MGIVAYLYSVCIPYFERRGQLAWESVERRAPAGKVGSAVEVGKVGPAAARPDHGLAGRVGPAREKIRRAVGIRERVGLQLCFF